MNARQIEAFQAVAKMGTVTAAASALHISQPAVSRLISHLELQVAIKLFSRSQGRLRLTPEGRALLLEVERHFVGLDAIAAAAQRIAEHGPGNLRIVAFPSLSSGILPQAICQFLDHHPGTAVTLDTDTTDQIALRVESGAYDVGFTAGAQSVKDRSVRAEVITRRPWVCAFPDKHPLCGRAAVTLAELERETLVGFSPGMSLRAQVDRLFSDQGLQPDFAVCAQTIESILSIVQTGYGGAIIHPYAIHIAHTRGLAVSTVDAQSTLDLAVVTPVAPARARVVDEFVKLVTGLTSLEKH